MNLSLRKSVFVLGDSLSSARKTPGWWLGQAIQDWTKNKDVIVFGIGGMALSYFTPNHLKTNGRWAVSAKLQIREVQKWKPHTVLVALGTNDYLAEPKRLVLATLTMIKLLKDAGVQQIVFVGPPSFNPSVKDGKITEGTNRFYSVLSKIPGVQLVDTRGLSADLVDKKSRPDGIHFSGAAAKVYGVRMYHELEKRSDKATPTKGENFLGALIVGYAGAKLISYLMRRL